MLHPVPDSTKRRRLLRVVALQRRLILRLCGLTAGAAVDRSWLEGVWHELPPEWIERFWSLDKGKRAEWIKTLAAASPLDKQRLADICREELRFKVLWQSGGGVTMHKVDWAQKTSKTFSAANSLLKSFYAPLLYDGEGYRLGSETLAKSHYLAGITPAARKVCPYCDNFLQKTELDHFLPKDEFPFLSCHPDNLIPSCPDSNSGSHKGIGVPLDWDAADQAANWFHPRWRSAAGCVCVEIQVTPDRQLSARLLPRATADTERVTNSRPRGVTPCRLTPPALR